MEAFVLSQNAKFKRKLYGILYNVENPEEMTGYLSKLKKHMKSNPSEVEEALKKIKLTKHHITRHQNKVKAEPPAPPISVSVPAKAKRFNMAEAKELIKTPEEKEEEIKNQQVKTKQQLAKEYVERAAERMKLQTPKEKEEEIKNQQVRLKKHRQQLAKEAKEKEAKPKPKRKTKTKEEPKPKAKSAQKVFDNPDLFKMIKGYRTRTLYDDMNEEEVKLTKALEMYYKETDENVERFYRMRGDEMVEIKGAEKAFEKEIAKELKLPKNWLTKAFDVGEKYGLSYGTEKGEKFAGFYRTKYD